MSGAHEPAANLQTLADQLKVLSDPTRLIVLDLLIQGVQCNCELSGQLQLAPNLISHHLRVLAQVGLVSTERDSFDARWVYYSVDKDVLEELTAAFGEFFNPERVKPRHPTCGPRLSVPSRAVNADVITADG